MPTRANHRLAREVRAARAYAGLSRKQVADATGLSADTIGRYERGKFKRTPTKSVLDAIARACEIPQAYLDAGFLAPATKRFADRVREESQRPRERPPSGPQDPAAEGDAHLGA